MLVEVQEWQWLISENLLCAKHSSKCVASIRAWSSEHKSHFPRCTVQVSAMSLNKLCEDFSDKYSRSNVGKSKRARNGAVWVVTGSHREGEGMALCGILEVKVLIQGAGLGGWLYSPQIWVRVEPQADCNTSSSTDSAATGHGRKPSQLCSAIWAPAPQGLLLLVWLAAPSSGITWLVAHFFLHHTIGYSLLASCGWLPSRFAEIMKNPEYVKVFVFHV